jgi:hypothetical protein
MTVAGTMTRPRPITFELAPLTTPFDRLGRFVVRRAWWIIGAWVTLLLVAIPLAQQVPGQLSAGGFILDDLESARAKALLGTELGTPPSALVIVLSSPDRLAGTPEFEVAAAAAVRDILTAPHVARVISPMPRQSRPTATRPRHRVPDLPPDDSPQALPILRERLHPAAGLDIELAGGPAFYGDVQTVSEADLRRSEVISLPLAALALLIVFGSAVAAGVPLAVGGAAVVVALAGIFVVATVMPMSIFVLNLATLLGLGLGVDYSLLMTSRFREELALRPDGPDRVTDAVRITLSTAGRAVFFSADCAARAARPGPVQFMDPKPVGTPARSSSALVAAALTPSPVTHRHRGRIDRFRGPQDQCDVGTDGPWSRPRAAPCATRRRPRPDARVPAPGSDRRSTCGLTRPTLDPAARGPVARRLRQARARLRRGRVRAARAGRPDERAGHRPGQPRGALRLLTTPGERSADPAGGQPGRRRSATDRGPVPLAVRGSQRSA